MKRAHARISTLALALLWATLGACGGSEPTPPAAQPPPAAPAREKVSLVWGSHWTLKVRPAFSGASLEKGTGTVTVDEWDNGPVSVHYEFPAIDSSAVPRAAARASVGALRPEAVKGAVAIPAARRTAQVFTPPAFWQGGDASAPGPLLWLPLDALNELHASKRTKVRLAPLPNGLRMEGTPASESDEVTLEVKGRAFGVLSVNGKPLRMQTLELEDDRGASYTVLDSADNPLVVRLRFGSQTIVAGKKLTTATSSGYDVIAMDGPPEAPAE